ncbi:hypothetical protein TIFTF001_004958 [Ficus carica]|uniref:Uncharacterized protein n=1 Tax=Ficus carica TaxID=3494 RepID=A0AA88CY01_FICCA|nr:hypothetical protein TIFTF001_004958 [Ficus carica]
MKPSPEKQQRGAAEMVGDPSSLSTMTNGLKLQTLNLPLPNQILTTVAASNGFVAIEIDSRLWRSLSQGQS